MFKKLNIFFLEIKEKILNLLKEIFLLHNKNSELIDVRSLNFTPVSHFVKAESLDKNFFFFQKKFKHILFHRHRCFTSKV